MIFIANASGTIEHVLPNGVNQNSNLASRVVLIAPFMPSVQVAVAFELPNGDNTARLPTRPLEMQSYDIASTKLGENYSMWYYDLSQIITAEQGIVGVQFFIYTGSQTITTNIQNFNVVGGVNFVNGDIENTIDDNLDLVLNYITELISNTYNGINETLESGSVFSAKNLKTTYVIGDIKEYAVNCLTTLGQGIIHAITVGEDTTNLPTDNSHYAMGFIYIRRDQIWIELTERTTNTIYRCNYEDGEWSGWETCSETVDTELSLESENPVQNKVVATKINEVEQTANTAKGIADDVLIRTLNLEVSKLNKSDIDTVLSLNSTNPVQNKVITNKVISIEDNIGVLQGRADALEIKTSGINTTIKEYVDDRFNGASKAVAFKSYNELQLFLNGNTNNNIYNVGQSIFIETLNVPDLWVSEIADFPENYDFIDDERLVNDLKTNGTVQFGYYILSPLETQKVDLTEYVKKDSIATINGQSITNGGNIEITVDTELSTNSTNPVQNKVITERITNIDANIKEIENMFSLSELYTHEISIAFDTSGSSTPIRLNILAAFKEPFTNVVNTGSYSTNGNGFIIGNSILTPAVFNKILRVHAWGVGYYYDGINAAHYRYINKTMPSKFIAIDTDANISSYGNFYITDIVTRGIV